MVFASSKIQRIKPQLCKERGGRSSAGPSRARCGSWSLRWLEGSRITAGTLNLRTGGECGLCSGAGKLILRRGLPKLRLPVATALLAAATLADTTADMDDATLPALADALDAAALAAADTFEAALEAKPRMDVRPDTLMDLRPPI